MTKRPSCTVGHLWDIWDIHNLIPGIKLGNMEMAMTRSLPTMSANQKKKRRRVTPTSVAKYSAAAPGLQRYLKLRGTPKGVYEISRTVNGSLRVLTDGWTDGTTQTKNLCFVFTPQYLRCYRDSVTTTFAQWSIPNASELAALWDEVKIDSVELTFTGIFSQYAINSASALTCPRQIIYGTDDNDTSTSASVVQQLGDCKVWYPNNSSSASVMKVTVKPKFNTLIYYTSVSSGYKPERGYVRSDYDIDHYALKMSLVDHQFTADNSYGNMQVNAKFNFKFKNLK